MRLPLEAPRTRGKDLALPIGPWFARHLNLIPNDAHFVAIDLNLRAIRPSAVADFEPPGVPWAGNDALVNLSRAKRGPHVRANVVNRKILAAGIEDRNQTFAHSHGGPLSLGNRSHIG